MKSFSTETSERYASALFQLAVEEKNLNIVEQNVSNFQKIYKNNPDLRNFIKNPTNTDEEQSGLVEALSKKINLTKIFKNFLLLLIKKRRIFFIEKILASFNKFVTRQKGEINASLISSKELSKQEIEKISKELSIDRGSSIKFSFEVDKSLIGGFKVQIGSLMIDSSIKNKLKKFQQLMIEN
ncbi:MAG: ATP synthase F1 subunit delta [Pseudomonadota bacterium]|nr:ATP synthase F1 subunit delta [Pseudomonadota bacterium]